TSFSSIIPKRGRRAPGERDFVIHPHPATVSIKCCLEEGLQSTCFEKSNDFGELWRFTISEHSEDGKPSLYKSMVRNSCKEISAFSDFPCLEHFPNYLPNSNFFEYLKLYAMHFDLVKHIQFKVSYRIIKKRSDFSTTGQWDIVTESNGKQGSSVLNAVMVCIGYLSESFLPLESFHGTYFAFTIKCFHVFGMEADKSNKNMSFLYAKFLALPIAIN
ncbi:flavin-containing monooxygenase 1-like, partial [Alligator mississippiensis]|uniref:flavin-containing monooxygenase 1-like n=1 Tax=Alligator mississippiensis TaxID=8496 RepID=UPI0028779F90